MAWRRPEAPRTPEEREAAHRLGLEMQADMHGIPVEEATLAARGAEMLDGPRRRDEDQDGPVESGCATFELVDGHPIALLLVPLVVLWWVVRRLRR